MSWNGAGVFNRLYSWTADAAAGIDITASRMDADTNDITGNGFGNCLTRDGQGIATALLPMGGFRHTGVGAGVALTDYARMDQLQFGVTWVVAGGTADAITATYSPAVAALTDGLTLAFRAGAANTVTNPTFAPNGLTAHAITKGGGSALVAGDIIGALAEYVVQYDLANTRWELLNPAFPTATTGTGSAVRATSPTLVTPALGAATATSLTTGAAGVTVNGTATVTLNPLTAGGSTTAANYLTLTNTSGGLLAGVESSTGSSIVSGAAGYSVTIGTQGSGKNFNIMQANALAAVISGSQVWQLPHYGAGAATFDASGNISSSSDLAIKERLEPFTASLPELRQFRPSSWYYTKESGLDTLTMYSGFVANDVEKSLPTAVGHNTDIDEHAVIQDAVWQEAVFDEEGRVKTPRTMLQDRVILKPATFKEGHRTLAPIVIAAAHHNAVLDLEDMINALKAEFDAYRASHP